MVGRERNLGIDALRGFSILIVMVLHGAVPLPDFVARSPLLRATVLNGYYGVCVFFVISGFLITSNTLRRYGEFGKISVQQFYAMRVGRIAPCVGVFVAAYALLFYLDIPGFVPAAPQQFYTSVAGLLTLQYHYTYVTGGNVSGLQTFTPLWSLSIEECFYLLFPLLCFFGRRQWLVAALLVGVAAYGPMFRTDFVASFGFFGAADLLAIGCLTAMLKQRIDYPRVPAWIAYALSGAGGAIVAAVFVLVPARELWTFGLTTLGLGTAMMLVGASHPARSPLALATMLWPLALIGRMSLQLYVFHQMIGQLLGRDLALMLALAWLLDRLVLTPANRWIRALYADPTPSPAPAPVNHLTSGERNRAGQLDTLDPVPG